MPTKGSVWDLKSALSPEFVQIRMSRVFFGLLSQVNQAEPHAHPARPQSPIPAAPELHFPHDALEDLVPKYTQRILQWLERMDSLPPEGRVIFLRKGPRDTLAQARELRDTIQVQWPALECTVVVLAQGPEAGLEQEERLYYGVVERLQSLQRVGASWEETRFMFVDPLRAFDELLFGELGMDPVVL